MSASAPAAQGVVDLAARLLSALESRGWTLAVAESLTGGAVCARLVDVPGASRVLRGGVVAYATDVKATLLGVDGVLLSERGAVDPDVAGEMAGGVRVRLGADVGLATTGVAGPDPQDGRAPGTVHVAVATPASTRVASWHIDGDRAKVRAATVRGVLELALAMVGEQDGPTSR
ncbi:MAG TPA: CinA family protein [Cellulomonas sp.]